ncbi:MAG: D-alanine--D-alanine ligase [Bifidobacterium tibiigranuli]|jgi:D-alanine-D-alanine ligase|uniref:D-alanine--D-alanine ligase family protein n=1 Tax=Bifidobacterium tibiigranuli TaxID=2172043 RepID=UPI0023543FBB|nr:D-alanine--D-alanine ligase [Bifidobacterium tibiigranuli]MCH3975689.1 D-alanine--D-alanine ligase [Bifidobacterium tibiigranuli]MCH4190364.1 D-alanine--D-alanine ligase [Bifidobacterium tibiigranuli]MCH4202974.1 D-alanine--D-alanine ligase [Bifidobacterium tibiigranuli]MCH4275006.1 D-alanine--D-alanine ligase [Bifidobacterium tibiigranuli]
MATIKGNPPSEATADSDSLGDEGEAHAGQVAAGKTGTSTGNDAGKAGAATSATSSKAAASVTLRPRNETSVLIICGGLSHERDISISSGHRVGGFLEDAGWQVRYHDMDSELLQYLSDPATRPDIVWPLLHGANGEDGSIRDILEMEGLPYIGSRAKASRTAWSKPIAKNVVRKLAGLSTSHSVTLPESMFRELGVGKVIDLLVDSLGLPLFIKPTMGGSALGCTLVTDAKQLPQAMVSCFAYGEVALVERAISGTEVSVSVLDIDGEPLVLPPLEIVTPNGTYDYDARYTPGPTDFYVPARLPATVLKATQDAALAAHRTLSLRDLSRTDFIVDADGIPQFLESNVTPGMTDTSLLPQAAVAAGYDLSDLYSQLVESVLRQDRAQPHR